MTISPSIFNLHAASLEETKLRFCAAAEDGDLDTLKQVMRKYPDAAKWKKPVPQGTQPFASNETPLMLAAANGQAKAMRLLIANGADIDAQHSRGWTALHHATWQNREESVDLLLWHRANTMLVNEGGHTAAALAFQRSHSAIGRKIGDALKLFGLGHFKRGLEKSVAAPKTAKFAGKRTV